MIAKKAPIALLLAAPATDNQNCVFRVQWHHKLTEYFFKVCFFYASGFSLFCGPIQERREESYLSHFIGEYE